MNFETTHMALQNLRRSPGRSGLTLLGLAIGVGAFISMVSFGEGARRTVMEQFAALGTNVVRVGTAGRGNQHPRPLSDRDVAALKREVPSASEVVPMARKNAEASYQGRRFWTFVWGTTAGFARVHQWPVRLGGNFSDVDLASRSKVCIVGKTIADNLYPGAEDDLLGKPLTLAGVLSCRIIGVLEEKGVDTSGRDLDHVVLVPISTYKAYLGFERYLNIKLQPHTPELVPTTRREAAAALRRSHDLGPNQADDFSIDSPLTVVRAVERTSLILTRLLQGIALVSLFVGGVGIMNIQLVAVAERTQEIGIRSAIGASPRQVLVQFLFEGALLSLLGSGLGVALGVAVSVGVAEAMGWERLISVSSVLGAACFGVFVGLLFGFLPARSAALLDPIEALRRE